MREFLREPWYWVYATLRWHWREVVATVGVVWAVLSVLLIIANLL